MERFSLVTGTSRGIGAAVAQAQLERGWTVLGLARGPAPTQLTDLGPAYQHVQLDLADLDRLEAWARSALRPRIEAASRVALVNNAALLAPVGPAIGLDLEALSTHLTVNLTAPIWLAGFTLASADPGSPVRIINVSSGAATKAYAGWSAYCAGKAGLHLAGEVLAEEGQAYAQLEQRDLAVVSYAPHVVATDMQAQLRSTPEASFPMRQRFVDLEQNGDLVAAEGPAQEIAQLCDRDDLERHQVLRFTP